MAITGFDYEFFINDLVAYAQENIGGFEEATADEVIEIVDGLYPTLEPGEAAAQQFYTDLGMSLGLSPNEFFVQDEYILAAEAHRDVWVENKIAANPFMTEAAAIKQYDDLLNANPYQHYLDIGAALGVNPSNAFDESDFIQSVLDLLETGMTVEDGGREAFIEAFGDPLSAYIDIVVANDMTETFPALPVPEDEQVDTNIPPVPTTFTLTNGTDVASANIFTAGQVYTPGGDDRINALQDEDILTGTGDNPTLNAELGNANDNGATIITPELLNIETVNVAFTGSGFAVTDLDMQDATALKEVNITRVSQSSDTARIENIKQVLDTMSIAKGNANNAGTVEFSFAGTTLRGDNTGVLNLSDVQIGQVNIGGNTSGVGATGVAGTGYENLTINSAGAANSIGILNIPMDTNTDSAVVITGDQNLTIARTTNVFNAATNTIESQNYGGGIALANGRLASIDASALTGNLTLNIAPGLFTAGKADTSGVVQNVNIKGGTGNDTFYLADQIQAGDSLAGGAGTDTVVIVAGGVIDANSSVTSSIEAVKFEVNSGAGTADFDKLPDVTGVSVRNISNNGAAPTAAPVAGNATFNLNNLTAAQAAAITINHANTGSNAIAQNIINANLKVVTGSSDTVALTIAEGLNTDPRFNVTLNAASVENITLNDADTESNTVMTGAVAANIASHNGTISVNTGLAGKFMNLDATGNGFGIQTNGANGSAASGIVAANPVSPFGLDSAFAAKYANTTYADTTGAGAGYVYNDIGVAAAERFVASTINAATFAGDLIVRVGDKNQTITTGTGNDTVIFDAIGATDSSRLTGGLNISDKVAMGTGFDTIIIDGNVAATETIGLADTEWTNLTGVDAIRLGNAGAGSYRLALSNSLIDQTDAGDRITIINSDGILGSAADSAATINMRALNNANFVDFYGANGNGVTESVNTLQVNEVTMSGNSALNGGDNNVVQAYTSAAMNTRFGIANATTLDANLAWAVVAGQTTAAAAGAAVIAANALTAGSGALTAANFGALLPDLNSNVLEIYNAAEITVGDLAKVSNFGTISAINDLGVEQTLNITLTDEIVDSMVDASHASSSSQTEIIDIEAYDNPTNAGAFERVNLQANTLTSKSGVHALLGRGTDVVQTGAGSDVVVMAGNYINGIYAVDATTGFNMNKVANWTDDSDDDNDGVPDMSAGADGVLGTADDVVNDAVMTKLVVTDTISLGTGTDTLITYGAIDLTGATISGVENLVVNSSITIDASDLARFTSVRFVGGVEHTLTIVDDSTTENIDLSLFKLEDTANLTIVPATTTFKPGSVVVDTSTGSVNGVNFNPVASDDGTSTVPFFTTGNNASVTITVAQLIANDTDANGDVLSITDVQNLGVTTDGTASIAGGVITFTPTAGFTGLASFDYLVSDGHGGVDTGTVTGTITAPVVVPTYALTAGAVSYNEGTSAVFNLVTTNVANGTVLNYTLSGTGIATADITGATALTGTVTVNSNAASISLPLAADLATEGNETLTMTLSGVTTGGTANTSIVDTSVAAGAFTNVDLASTAVTATAAAEAFVYDFQMVGGRPTTAGDGAVTISGFITTGANADKLVFQDAGTGIVYTEALFVSTFSTHGLTISENPVTNTTAFYFDANPTSGVVGSVTLTGVADAALANIVVETLA